MTNYVFDLDATLYQDNGEIEDDCINLSLKFLMSRLNLDQEQAKSLRDDILRRYYWEAEALKPQFGISEKEFLDYVCDTNVSHLPATPELNDLLAQLQGRRFIYTDSTIGHVRDTLHQIGVREYLFELVVDAERNDFVFKFQDEAFERFCEICQIAPQDTIIFEDSLRNIKRAKKAGLTTVLISKEPQDFPEADYQFRNIIEALNFFLK